MRNYLNRALIMLTTCLLLSCTDLPAGMQPPNPDAESAVAENKIASQQDSGSDQAEEVPDEESNIPATDTPMSVATDTPQPLPTDTPLPLPTNTPLPLPTDTPLPLPTDTPEPVATSIPLFYNLPPAVLTTSTGLYASPNRSELIIPVAIPEGEIVYVMGKNGTGSHLRVVWNTGIGWIPVSFTDYIGKRARMAALPVFEREPPQCAIPVTTQFGLNSTWTSEDNQRIAVIIDLFRSRYGDFPNSFMTLVVNGFVIESSRRSIVEQGQFSLKDVVFTLPQNVQPGDVMGYQLDSSSGEPLTFMSTIFSVPRNCQWKLD